MHQIDVERRLPERFVVSVDQRSNVPDEDVETAKVLDGPVDPCLVSTQISDVHRFTPCSIAEFGDGCRDALCATRTNRHLRTFVNQRSSDLEANPPRAAGDDGAFAIESEIHGDSFASKTRST